MRFKRFNKRTTAIAIAVGLWLAMGGLAAFATHNPCHDESIPHDVWHEQDISGITTIFVGVDTDVDGNGTFVCYAALGGSPESQGVVRYDPSPSSPGFIVHGRFCNGNTCNDGTWFGAELGTVSPSTDLPGDGTLGGGMSLNGQCLWLGGQLLPTCGSAGSVNASVAEGDLPTTEPISPCALNLNEGPCEVNNYKVTIGGDTGTTDADKTVVITRSGLGTASGTNSYDQAQACVKTTISLSCS